MCLVLLYWVTFLTEKLWYVSSHLRKQFAFNCSISLESGLKLPGHYDIMCLCYTGQLIHTSVNSRANRVDTFKQYNERKYTCCVAHMSDTQVSVVYFLQNKDTPSCLCTKENKRKGIVQFELEKEQGQLIVMSSGSLDVCLLFQKKVKAFFPNIGDLLL